MILPSLAIVRPRAVCPETGESLPLEELVESFFFQHQTGAIEIVGGPGSGKTTALAHLAEVLYPCDTVLYLDEPTPSEVVRAMASQLVVYTTSRRWHNDIADVVFDLSPWGEDDLIEFLLAAHRGLCRSVILRIRAAQDRGLLGGSPELWRIAIERMARDDSIAGLREVLMAETAAGISTMSNEQLVQDYALAQLRGADEVSSSKLIPIGSARLLRMLRYRVVQTMLAGTRLRKALEQRDYALFRRLPYELVSETAATARDSAEAMNGLRAMLAVRSGKLQSTAASILHATATGWTPVLGDETSSLPCMWGAHLAGAKWPGVKLPGVLLTGANLIRADLDGATLTSALAVGCRLARATLRKADLTAIILRHADLHGADCSGATMKRADLTHANLISARFRSSELCGADLREARIDDADFSGANLTVAKLDDLSLRKATFAGADFNTASLVRCDMERMRLRRAHFVQADLSGALLTGSVLPRAGFQWSSLRGAGLAEIQWERADLRHADLRDCSFFLGSSRSGLVGSPLASEGSRTGFYTDDFEEQTFKSPEEIRKANLRGADLRGAKIDGVDFYLVDLRNAKYTRKQGEQFRRCGAILSKHRAG